ncbi:MAG: hypothetical protein HUK40_09225 [Desulfobacter sp.]|nr:hypothetical protein [Desulfobacter sp.]WDP84848.1 MAG: hypothetical protein HUN05_06530 [Desulfobacter sp.]
MSCALARPLECESAKGGVLRYALHSSKLDSLDPFFVKGAQSATYADMVFNGLLRYTPGDVRKIEPDLALEMPKFVIKGGKQVWTVHLKSKVFFHESPYFPAHELTAQDVVLSLKKVADPEQSVFSGYYQGMTFEVVNSYALNIILDQPVSFLFFFPLITNWRGGIF